MVGITAFIPVIGELLDRLLPDKQAAEEAKLKYLELIQKGDLAVLDAEIQLAVAQLEVNKAEAVSPSTFVSGWRPFIGWVGGFALVYQFIGRPLLAWASLANDLDVPPELDMGDLITIVGGMLGMAAMRTKEKLSGVARNSLVALVLLAAGCAHAPRRPECEAEYAYTIPSCEKARPATEQEMRQAGYVQYCEVAGGYKKCSWVHEDVLRRALERR